MSPEAAPLSQLVQDDAAVPNSFGTR